jgi:DNA-binding response OmpR family regulator
VGERRGSLAGRSVLVVEDEPLIALDLQGILKVAGASVINCFNANDAIRSISLSLELSAAVLDVNLGTEDCSRVCRALAKRHIPFVFYTAYTRAHVVDQWPGAPVISKPASMTKIVAAVAKLVERADRSPD